MAFGKTRSSRSGVMARRHSVAERHDRSTVGGFLGIHAKVISQHARKFEATVTERDRRTVWATLSLFRTGDSIALKRPQRDAMTSLL